MHYQGLFCSKIAHTYHPKLEQKYPSFRNLHRHLTYNPKQITVDCSLKVLVYQNLEFLFYLLQFQILKIEIAF